MAETPSTMLALGTDLPPFSLPDLDGRIVSDREVSRAQALVVAFFCPHCPYVRHVRKAFVLLAQDYQPRDVAFVAINSNDPVAYPEDDRAGMTREASGAGFTFPYLHDETQEVAKAFRAACTPDFFVFDRHRRLVYRGQFDRSRPGSPVPVTGDDLRAALDALIAGHSPSSAQYPSVGCNIKWKRGNAPGYA
jgi:thiol-disulfide isomerase/thioredoxin